MLRVKLGHDCFDGNYYKIQKRTLFFFWRDVSGWYTNFDSAKKVMDIMLDNEKSGLAI